MKANTGQAGIFNAFILCKKQKIAPSRYLAVFYPLARREKPLIPAYFAGSAVFSLAEKFPAPFRQRV
jgi:hypothetical protein